MPHILVTGGANLDIKAKALAPNRLATSNPSTITTSPGGVARNIAHNLARLGADVGLIASIGHDAQGHTVLEATRKAGVDVSRIITTAPATGTYIAILNSDGELVTANSDMRAVDDITPAVITAHEADIAKARYIIADCNLPLETLRALANIAHTKLFIEPVSVPKSEKMQHLLQDGPIFMASPNLDQVEHLTGTRELTPAVQRLHAMGLINVIIHAGVQGAYVSDGKTITHCPAQPAGPIVDVTGAGDAAVAGLVFALSQGKSLEQAAAFGQMTAGRVVASAQSTLE
jgi:pseudouridine kinase